MTNTLILAHAGRELCKFEATDKNLQRLANRIRKLPSLDPNNFVSAATRLMDAAGDIPGPDLDIAIFTAIRQIAAAAANPRTAETIASEKIVANMLRGADGNFQRFAFNGFEPAQSPHTLTLEYEGTTIIIFEATPENIKDLSDEVIEAKPQGNVFLGSATRLMDDPGNPLRADCGLMIFMALRELATADGPKDITIADVLATKNVRVRLVRHDDEGIFHFHFYDENGDDNDGKPLKQ